MRIKALLLGAVAALITPMFAADSAASAITRNLAAEALGDAGGYFDHSYTKRSGKGAGGSLAHRRWRKLRSSGRR